MKKEKEIKIYHSILEFNEDFFVEPPKKSTKLSNKEDDNNYGKILAVELLDELKEKIN
jgi:hypothetical protein